MTAPKLVDFACPKCGKHAGRFPATSTVWHTCPANKRKPTIAEPQEGTKQ